VSSPHDIQVEQAVTGDNHKNTPTLNEQIRNKDLVKLTETNNLKREENNSNESILLR